ncbi:MAG: HAD-IA family hydrolase [bacterium]
MKTNCLNKIKWILFDMGGVVIHFIMTNPCGYSIGTKFFNQKDLEGFFYTKEYNDYMLGNITHVAFMSRYFKKNNLDLTVDEFDKLVKKDITPTPGIEKLIQRLSKKYKIALATNEGEVLTTYKINGSKIKKYLSKTITSYELKEIKPSIPFFKKMLAMLPALPEECVFVDDTKANIQSAVAVGIPSILFENSKQLEEELKSLHVL